MAQATVKCSLCDAECSLDTQKSNIATTSSDGTIYCIPCYDVALFVGNLSEAPMKQKTPTASTTTKPKVKSIITAFCPKCKASFETKCPTCDMINPLSRSISKKKKKGKGKKK